uniref:Uncharacterized protein n=1 Tax=Anopheles minimus TaxID=112268 RepID=A0A182WCW1_9DIPT
MSKHSKPLYSLRQMRTGHSGPVEMPQFVNTKMVVLRALSWHSSLLKLTAVYILGSALAGIFLAPQSGLQPIDEMHRPSSVERNDVLFGVQSA